MKIHHIRNATFIIESIDKFILIDPMLGEKGSGIPFTFIRFKARKNPIVALPNNSRELLDKVTDCIITHQHPDHIDKDGEQFLKKKNIPVFCSVKDEKSFRKKGLNVIQTVKYWEQSDFLGGSIMGIPARHGYGFIAALMGNVMGFYIEIPNTPSIYISADTIYTEAVEKVLREMKPDFSVLASGSAQLDIGQPLLMRVDDIIKFANKAQGKVMANHLEALNHCPTTREGLKARLQKEGLEGKVFVPKDGECIEVK